MTIKVAKEKLHSIIDNASESVIFSLLAWFEGTEQMASYKYDEETLNILRERSQQYLSGKEKTYSIEESLEMIRRHRNENEV